MYSDTIHAQMNVLKIAFTAVITFEETDYVTSEMDGSVDVCVTVLNGILVNSLTVNIDLLPSTALGKQP